MKKHMLGVAVALTLGSLSSESISSENGGGFIMKIPLKQKMSSWSGTAPIYHPWTNIGSHYNCETWSPNVNTVDYGQNFTQTRDCSQDQQRDVEIREKDSFSGTVKTVNTVQEERTITETESQSAVGTYQNWVSHTSTYTAWEDFGDNYDYAVWSPVASTQTADFTQSRDFKHDQERFEQKRERDTVTGDVRETGDPIRHTQVTNRDESRSVDVNVTAWSDVGDHYDCAAWSPLPSTVDVYESFTQTRDCKQNQTREWTYNASGAEIHSRFQNQTITEVESQSAVGTKRDWNLTTSTFTEWTDYGAHHSPEAWSPVPSTQTADFGQTRGVKQPQERFEQKRELDAVSGEIRDTGEPIRHTRNIDETESRTVDVSFTVWTDTDRDTYTSWSPAPTTQTAGFTQSRTYSQNQTRNRVYKADGATLKTAAETRTLTTQSESRSVTVSWSNWVDKNGHYDCGVWSPATNTVGYGVSFTQTRSCKQDQTRNRIYKASDATIATKGENRTVNETESRSATGVGSWTSHTSTFTSWANSGSVHSYSDWSPSASNQTNSFTQTRSYKQPQSRTEQKREIDTISGAVRNVGESITQNRNVDGSESRLVSVLSGGWKYHSDHLFGVWSPDSSTICSGESFTQSQSYKEKQVNTYSFSIGGSHNIYRDVDRTRTRTSTGTKVCENWVSHSSYTSAWTNSGSGTNYSSYSPAISTQTTSFSQTRSWTQPQSRTVQEREIDLISGEIRNVGDPIVEYRTITQYGSRSVRVEWDSWQYSGSSCGSWSPSTSTVNQGTTFTQTRDCNDYETRQRKYYTGHSLLLKMVQETRYDTSSQTRTATGTKVYVVGTSYGSWSSWYNMGGPYNWSGWSSWCSQYPYGTPTIYTTRDYDQDQGRERMIYDDMSDGSRRATHIWNYEYRTLRLTMEFPNYDCTPLWDSTTPP